jgi:hypothetical protein
MTGPCGTIAEDHHDGMWAGQRPETASEVRREALVEAGRLGIPPAMLGQRYSRTVRDSYVAFSCPACRALFGDYYLRDFMLEERMMDNFTVITLPGSQRGIEEPHWCIDRGHGHCVISQ